MIDLEKLEKDIDALLESETAESFNEWLLKQNKSMTHSQAAEQYEKGIIPKLGNENVPYFTILDRRRYITEAFIAGYKFAQEWYKTTEHPKRFRNLDVSIDVVAELPTGVMIIASYHYGINKWLNGMEEIEIKHWQNLPTPPEDGKK